ncbi:MAG: CDP-alcohol phosphatidyltransferase family protein, partial [Solirubrobacterales bacterium]|nr:CDP-alcohol phosphatidyltransferase family protein [Solirubrobacterales bacterium]
MAAGTMSALRSSRMLAAGTGLRIVLAPAVMALLLGGSRTAATVLFLIAAGTDWFDGRLARRWGITTKLGSFLDTTADKLLVTTALVGLVAIDRASP